MTEVGCKSPWLSWALSPLPQALPKLELQAHQPRFVQEMRRANPVLTLSVRGSNKARSHEAVSTNTTPSLGERRARPGDSPSSSVPAIPPGEEIPTHRTTGDNRNTWIAWLAATRGEVD
jgi:hypothetical protein